MIKKLRAGLNWALLLPVLIRILTYLSGLITGKQDD